MPIEKLAASDTAGEKSMTSPLPGPFTDSPTLGSPRDLEKQSLGQQCPSPRNSYSGSAHCTNSVDMDGDDTAEEDDPARHAMKILVVEILPNASFVRD